MRNILEIRDLQVHYGGIEAVRGISLDVPEGEIVTQIGANGAGKSSTLRAIAGLVKPSAGKISFLDEDITGMDSSLIVSKGITLVPEGRRIFPDMTVLENLKIGAYLRKDDLTEDLNWVYDLFPRLKERSWQAAGTLSGAPKIRACEIIRELENNKRGLYGGAIGYLDFTGNLDTCIAIRLAFRKNGRVFVRSGAGIVADSVPDKEYQECLNKARAVLDALETAQGGLDA